MTRYTAPGTLVNPADTTVGITPDAGRAGAAVVAGASPSPRRRRYLHRRPASRQAREQRKGCMPLMGAAVSSNISMSEST
eukprot:13148449-Heterocapsa_arctica.AAC.1